MAFAYDSPAETLPAGGTGASGFLQQAMQSQNVVELLDDTELAKIAGEVIEEYQIDKDSRKDWEDKVKEATKLAMLVSEQKDYPFEKAANIKYPLLTTAALQFNARAYPAIVQGNRVVRCVTWGDDATGQKRARADRVAEHMSYQLLAEMPEWEEDTDKMLVILPIVGCVFRKVYYDPALKRNCSRLVTAERLVVNYWARSLLDVPRCTEEMHLYPNEIVERIRSGRFVEFDYQAAGSEAEDKKDSAQNDPTAPHLFLEQHRLLDLDEDGYAEPYIVTVHKSSQKVCRIVANYSPESISQGDDGKVHAIRRQDYYVKYQFLPSPDGGFYGLGFGWLLADITEAINATLNQMLDAGHLTNVQGGLVSAALGIKEKSIKLALGEWRVVNTNAPLNQSVMPITYPGPSQVLFNLLGLLVEAGREVAAIKDVLTGEVRQNMTASATLALIEQGLQVFTAIFKRIHRSLKAELGIMARLNRKHLTPDRYAAFFDGQEMSDPQRDYSEQDMDILPVSDPHVASRMQELAKAQLIREVSQENPTINPFVATRRVLEAAQIDDIDELMMPQPQPDPEQELLTKLAAYLQVQNLEADVIKKQTAALKDVATAGAQEDGAKLQQAKLVLDALRAEVGAEQGQAQQAMQQQQMAMEQAQAGAQPGAGAQGLQPGMDGMAEPEGFQQAPDGNWYAPDPDRPGKFVMLETEGDQSLQPSGTENALSPAG
jgi:chaperonin GroES